MGELPAHGHTIRYKASDGTLPWGWLYENSKANVSSTSESSSGIGLTGNSEKHNTVQSYIVAYIVD